MNHLTAAEFVDLLEGQLAAGRARHADSCDACRTQRDDLRAALLQTAEVAIPEPSPLFWEHLSARVQEGIGPNAATGPDGVLASLRRPALAWLSAAAVVTLVAATWLRSTTPIGGPDDRPNATATASLASSTEWDDEEAWAKVRAAAEKATPEDADEAGIAARPGEAESAMNGLTDKERERLLMLLEEELKRSGA
jgi:hypothetical protein